MRVHRSRLTILVVSAALAGCGGAKQDDPAAPDTAAPAEAQATTAPDVKVIQPGAPGEESKEVVPTPTPKGGGFVPEDVEFMQKMILHHDQALVMTALVPKNGGDTSVRLLAKRMEVSQQDEVLLMKQWLENRNFKADGGHADHASMPGMLTDEQLAELKAAKGREFDRLFLQFMTQHHEGALQMVRDLVFAGGGSEAEISQFVGHVDSDQSIEIQRMAELSEKLS